MSLDLSPEQLEQLQNLGISLSDIHQNTSDSTPKLSNNIKITPESSLSLDQNNIQTISSSQDNRLLNNRKIPLIPIFSISGLTLFSFGGFFLFRSRNQTNITTPTAPKDNQKLLPTPTQVPKSIQHFLLTSQQYFSQALSLQNQQPQSPDIVNLLNQSITTATDAIKLNPQDFRAWEQRGRIYISLVDSQPDLLPQAISDLERAFQANPSSPEITRQLALLSAKKGDLNATLAYLQQTVLLEPTRAQNFYELAKLQQKTGQLSQALESYRRLLTLVTDPQQKQNVQSEASALEQLLAQNHQSPVVTAPASPTTRLQPTLTDSKLLEAHLPSSGLIIAAPETRQTIEVKSVTDSNSLSGNATLPAGQTSLTLTNTRLTPTSQVYLTIITGGKNQTLELLSKTAKSFTVGFSSPLNEPVEFKWWIVN